MCSCWFIVFGWFTFACTNKSFDEIAIVDSIMHACNNNCNQYIMQQREISLTHPAWTAQLLAVAHQLQVYIKSDYSHVTAKIDSLIYTFS